MNKRKRLPYGIADFRTLIQSDCYYVDRTQFIRKMEESNKYLFFLRPRLFGKSLTISMLEYYYGLQFKDDFDSLFSELYIGQKEHTTPNKNNYYVLRFDFTGINTSNLDDIMESFNNKIRMGLLLFNESYNLLDRSEFEEISQQRFPASTLEFYLSKVSSILENKIMILIDEYDHFTNEILSFHFDTFSDIVSKNGFVRKFYETIKYFTGKGIIERFFATGVTPVTLDSMTSGFNIGTNISLHPQFNEMTGFTTGEVEKMIYDLLPGIQAKAAEKILQDVAAWYNGSLFSPESTTRLYNPTMLLRFFSEINPVTLKYPREMVDSNILTDFSKIKKIVNLENYEVNVEVIDTILKTGSYPSNLTQIFTFERKFTVQDFITMLFYNGLLTIKGQKDFDLLFEIPNYVVKEVFWDFFANEMTEKNQIEPDIEDLKNAVRAMGNSNDVRPVAGIVESILQNLSNRDFMNFDEKYVKLLFIVYISLTKSFKIKSEQEVNLNYPDLMFLNSQNYSPAFQHLFEIKYIKKSDASTLEDVKSAAIKQVERYKQLPEIKEITNLKFWVIIFTGSSCSEVVEVI
ncbi:MAG: ATP-binding protein [Bacteroidetes bacterium]|nr:ATP-binding protein [Bacteroidota bacterium]